MKQKSLKQIYEQAYELMHQTACKDWNGKLTEKAEQRIKKIIDIEDRYDANLLKHFNQRLHLTNEQWETPVPRSVYANY